jgi:hypothetical protein
MGNLIQRAFAKGLAKETSARDKLLFVIGSTAIMWYLFAITWIGLYPLTFLRNSTSSRGADSNPQPSAAGTDTSVSNQDLVQKSGNPVNSGTPAADTSELSLWQFMAFSVTTIAGTLATFVGMVLGFGQVAPAQSDSTDESVSPMQQAAAWAYFGSLVYGLALWGLNSFLHWMWPSVPLVDPAIAQLGQSILGLFGGVLAVVLNVPNTSPAAARTLPPT